MPVFDLKEDLCLISSKDVFYINILERAIQNKASRVYAQKLCRNLRDP